MSIDVLLSSDYNYTGNLPGKFINYLSNKIETDKKLKVCLKNISFCNSYDIKLCDIKIEYNITNNDVKNTFTSKNKTRIYDNTNYFFNYLHNNYKNSYININSSTLIILKEILEKFTENNNSILNDIQKQNNNHNYESTLSFNYFVSRIETKMQSSFIKTFLSRSDSNHNFSLFQTELNDYLYSFLKKVKLIIEKVIEKNKIYKGNDSISIIVENKKNPEFYYTLLTNFFFDNKYFKFVDNKLVLKKYLDAKISIKSDFLNKNIFLKKNEIIFNFTDQSQIEFDKVFIYSNIICDEFCPSIKGPLLKFFSIKNNKEVYVEKIFNRPSFVTINKSVIEKIEITLTDKNKNIIQFKEAPVICEIEIK